MRECSRLLGIDYGTVRIGVAVSDPGRTIAFPLATYVRQDAERDAEFFRDMVAEEEIVGFVVGLPMHTDGREGLKAEEARAFGSWLGEQTQLPVAYFDERFTTVQAEAILWDAGLTHKRRRERRDRLAAQLVLQAYLDAGCPVNS